MSFPVDFALVTNQWIAPNATIFINFYFDRNGPDQYTHFILMPTAPASLLEIKRTTYFAQGGGIGSTLQVQNENNYWVQFNTDGIRVPSQ